MFNNIKTSGLLGAIQSRSSQDDCAGLRSARLPWWVTKEIVHFHQTELGRTNFAQNTIDASADVDFLVVPPTKIDCPAAMRRSLFDEFSEWVSSPVAAS